MVYLEGEDLWSALTSGQKIKSHKPTKKERKKHLLTTPVYTPKAVWKDQSIVLLVHKTHCKCGGNYEAPNPIKFIKRKRITDGALHWRRLDEIQIFEEAYARDLPFEIAYEVHHVSDCQRCFGIEQLLCGAAITHTSDVPESLPEPAKVEYQTALTGDSNPTQQAPEATPVAAAVPGFIPDAPLAEDEDLANAQLEA